MVALTRKKKTVAVTFYLLRQDAWLSPDFGSFLKIMKLPHTVCHLVPPAAFWVLLKSCAIFDRQEYHQAPGATGMQEQKSKKGF